MRKNIIMKKGVVTMVIMLAMCTLIACSDDEKNKMSKEKTKETEITTEQFVEETKGSEDETEKETETETEEETTLSEEGTIKQYIEGDYQINMTNVKSERIFSFLSGNWKLLKEIYYDGKGNVTGEKVYNDAGLSKYVDERAKGSVKVCHNVEYGVKKYYFNENNENIWYETYYSLDGKLISMTEGVSMESWYEARYEHEYTYYSTKAEEVKTYSELQLVSGYLGRAILYNGEVYVEIQDTGNFFDYILGEGNSKKLNEKRETFSEYYIEGIGNLKCLKLNVSNIKEIYDDVNGQSAISAGNKGIILIHEDESVSFSYYKDLFEGKVEVVKLPVKNIFDIVRMDENAVISYFVDENGEMAKVNMFLE